MELRHLRYFVAVAEELHFRRASERLHVSQPPLSLQIRQLEEEIGVRLLERNRQSVSLTPAGRDFLLHARDVLARVEQARRSAESVASGASGELRLGYTPSARLLPWLPRGVMALRALHPAVTIQFNESDSVTQINAISNRELDIGILRRPDGPLPATLVFERWVSDPLCVAVPASRVEADGPEARQAWAVRDLEDASLISTPRDSGAGLHHLVTQLCWNAGFSPDIVMEAPDLITILVLVATGHGIAVVPSSTQCVAVEGVRFIPLEGSQPAPDFYLVSHAARGALVQGFVEILLEQTKTGRQVG